MDVERERIPQEQLGKEQTDKEQADKVRLGKEIETWLEEQRERLESLRLSLDQEVFGEDQGGATGELTTVDQHPADTADFLETREETVAVETMLSERRRQIEIAIEKLRRGEYGICERCSKSINPERLAARPDALYCIDCQRIMERRRPAA